MSAVARGGRGTRAPDRSALRWPLRSPCVHGGSRTLKTPKGAAPWTAGSYGFAAWTCARPDLRAALGWSRAKMTPAGAPRATAQRLPRASARRIQRGKMAKRPPGSPGGLRERLALTSLLTVRACSCLYRRRAPPSGATGRQECACSKPRARPRARLAAYLRRRVGIYGAAWLSLNVQAIYHCLRWAQGICAGQLHLFFAGRAYAGALSSSSSYTKRLSIVAAPKARRRASAEGALAARRRADARGHLDSTAITQAAKRASSSSARERPTVPSSPRSSFLLPSLPRRASSTPQRQTLKHRSEARNAEGRLGFPEAAFSNVPEDEKYRLICPPPDSRASAHLCTNPRHCQRSRLRTPTHPGPDLRKTTRAA
jgi:hypothetical protein